MSVRKVTKNKVPDVRRPMFATFLPTYALSSWICPISLRFSSKILMTRKAKTINFIMLVLWTVICTKTPGTW